ncbi:MAG: STAS domain-containing protein [Chitinivibrionales bacterium]|nr:STAS domain-containing protein [Chitinivibrionales bacterium]
MTRTASKESPVRIETYSRGPYQILRINGGNSITDLSELRDLVSHYLDKGKRKVAVSFSSASYIFSGALKVLIDCYNKIADLGGDLCIIEPNPSLFDTLEMLNIDRVIGIYVSEDYLPDK